ncbi:MAG: large subunit ribosomal protein L13 [Parcubacteria group bacterium Gr01-1014_38]|nr:MAG: large subunit ribosomal protein L13 [Parcubacteria group bacterium Gr01-1014_38]
MTAPKRTSQPSEAHRPWRFYNAEEHVLGRLATEVAIALRGKDHPQWVPYRDTGAIVVVTNTDRVRVTGTKRETKVYMRHTQRKPGAVRILSLRKRLERDSRTVVRDAIWNMLPKNRLRHRMILRLKLYQGAEHPHLAQKGGANA